MLPAYQNLQHIFAGLSFTVAISSSFFSRVAFNLCTKKLSGTGETVHVQVWNFYDPNIIPVLF